MKILLLVPSLNTGGVETGTVDLSKSLKAFGEEVAVVSSGGTLVDELDKYGIKHYLLPIHKKSLAFFLQIPKIIKIIVEERVDVVHAQSRVPAWIAYFACKKTGVPFVTSCHGYYSKHLFSSVMGKGKRVIVISKMIASHMQENFKVSSDRIRLVFRGVDLTKYHFNKEKYDIKKDKFIVTNIARLTPIKGQKEFIEAINILVRQKIDIEVWIVGGADTKNRGYEVELKKLVGSLGLDGKIKFLGSRRDIPEILEKTDLLVLSTQTPEAFGRVIIEAGASGTAVCATNIGGISEIIENGKSGLLFIPGDVKSIADSMFKMLKNVSFMKECAENLRHKVENEFSLERMTKETLAVYIEAVEAKNILVIKLGGIGDLILAGPSFRALRKSFPYAKISVLTNKNAEQIVKNCPYIDEVIFFDRLRDSFLNLVCKLRKKDFDISIDFKNNSMSHVLAFLIQARLRFGFSKGGFSFLLNNAQQLSNTDKEEPVTQQFRMLGALGIKDLDNSLELWPSKENEFLIKNILLEKNIFDRDKLVGIVIEASSSWPTKNWPLKNFVELSVKLIQAGYRVVLLGDKFSKKNIKLFPKDRNVINFIGETTLDQLISLIKRLDVIVTPDSAPMHIAAATGTRIVALFGPTDPKRHAPPSNDIKILSRDIKCSPCYKRACINRDTMVCLKNIGVNEVFDTIVEQI